MSTTREKVLWALGEPGSTGGLKGLFEDALRRQSDRKKAEELSNENRRQPQATETPHQTFDRS